VDGRNDFDVVPMYYVGLDGDRKMNCLTFALWYWWNWGGKLRMLTGVGQLPHFYVDNEKDGYIASYHSDDYLRWWQQLHYEGEYLIEPCDGW
tara:strand:+ start:96 stop:371 length:276 start_codon:yes stop_codon:yes gene_type:complete